MFVHLNYYYINFTEKSILNVCLLDAASSK